MDHPIPPDLIYLYIRMVGTSAENADMYYPLPNSLLSLELRIVYWDIRYLNLLLYKNCVITLFLNLMLLGSLLVKIVWNRYTFYLLSLVELNLIFLTYPLRENSLCV